MKITDLRYETDCIEKLAKWHHSEWAHLNPGSSLESRIATMLAYLGDPIVPSMFVCKEGDLLLGSAAIVENDMDTRTELSPWLASVYVEKTYRKQGLGTALVNHVVNVAKNAGFSYLYLFTPDKEDFYWEIGWFTISKEIYRDVHVTVMRFRM